MPPAYSLHDGFDVINDASREGAWCRVAPWQGEGDSLCVEIHLAATWTCDRGDVTNREKDAAIAEGLAAYAATYFEMGATADVVRTNLIAQWERLGSPAGAFRAAAMAVSGQPQPVVESAETTERNRIIREHLDVTSAETQLAAALRARELLQDLAEEHG